MLAAGLPSNARAATLEEAVRTALATNPRVQEAGAQERAAVQDVAAARAGYFPSLDVTGNIGREESDIKQLHLSTGFDNRYLTKREFGVTVRQLLFDGFDTASQVARRRALLEGANGSLQDVRETIAFQAAQAYLDVLRNRRLVSLAEDNVISHEEVLGKVNEKVSSGLIGNADLHQATARLALANSVLTAREGALREVVSRYHRVIGEFPGELTEPESSRTTLVSNGAVDEERLAGAIQSALTEAMRDHPAIQAAQSGVVAAEQAVRGSRAAYLPRLDLEGVIGRNDNISGVGGVRNTNAVQLVGQWNLFRGGGDRATELGLVERRFAAMDATAEVQRAIREQVAVGLQAKATSEQRLVYLRAHVASSERTLESYEAGAAAWPPDPARRPERGERAVQRPIEPHQRPVRGPVEPVLGRGEQGRLDRLLRHRCQPIMPARAASPGERAAARLTRVGPGFGAKR